MRDEPDYPRSLGDLSHPPPHLFMLGSRAALDAPVVAVVGTRDVSGYGERMTREIAGSLARAGISIVSGLARGVDAAAHRAALAAGGRTVAVLGTGIDVPYPVGHRELHQEIARRGALLSEHAPGVGATKGCFPKRNRIIAALASVTIVVEAPVRSGALITAGHALELGRTVAAVPGPIDSPRSEGTNLLIRDGAVVIASVADALALFGCDRPAPHRAAETLAGDERTVWEALSSGGSDADTLSARTRLPARRCLAAIGALEILGLVECALTGEVRRR